MHHNPKHFQYAILQGWRFFVLTRNCYKKFEKHKKCDSIFIAFCKLLIINGARQNREVIKAAQRTAHDIEHICGHPEAYDERWRAEAETWVARYAAYRAHIPAGSTRYYHFYNYVYVTIYREMQGKDKM